MGSMNFPGVSEIGTSTGHPYAHDLTMPLKDYSSQRSAQRSFKMGSMNFPGVSEIGTSTGHPYAHDLTMPLKDYSSQRPRKHLESEGALTKKGT